MNPVLFVNGPSASHYRYFSSLFAASKNFPEYIGFASGSSMALFGLSPLFLSVLASAFFTSEDNVFDVTRFVTFLAILTGVVHIIGALTLKTPSIAKAEEFSQDEASRDEENTSGQNSERTPLIAPKNRQNVQITIVPVEHEQNVFDLLKDLHFWLLALIVLVGLGSVSLLFEYG